MKLVHKTTQKLGEGVGVFDKTKEDEEFKKHDKFFTATSKATSEIISELTPESCKGESFLHIPGKEVKLKTDEGRRGKTLYDVGVDLRLVDLIGNSPLADALVCLGEGMQEIGERHASHDKTIMDSSIGPIKSWNDSVLKELKTKEKNYESKRVEYDAAKRVAGKKKEGDAYAKAKTKKKAYKEARKEYIENVAALKATEKERIQQLHSYAKLQAAYLEKIVEDYKKIAHKLGEIEAKAIDFQATYSAPEKTHHEDPHANAHLSASGGYNQAPSGHGHPGSGYGAPQQPQYQQQQQYQQPQYQQQYQQAPPSHGHPGSGYGAQSYGGPPSHGHPSGGSVSPRGPAPLPGAGGPPPVNRGAPPIPIRVQQCRALYDFSAQTPQELPFRAGDIIVVRKTVNQDWIEGELNGRVGLIPSTYVQMV